MAEEAPKTSPSDLMSSAKTVAEAAQLAASQQMDKIDKTNVSGAAKDLIEAAKTSGKLDDNQGIGQYLEKTEGYLDKQHGDHAGGEEKEKEKEKESGSEGGILGGAVNIMTRGFHK